MFIFKDSILKFHLTTLHFITFTFKIQFSISFLFHFNNFQLFFHSIKSSDSQRNVLFNQKERLKVEIFYTFNRKSKQKYLALSLSNNKNGCYIFMFYYVDPHLYKTKYATTSNTRAGLPGRISVGTILFSLLL